MSLMVSAPSSVPEALIWPVSAVLLTPLLLAAA
jgi:hypothetical protein